MADSNGQELTLDEINEILAGTRSRTNAGSFLSEFVKSGELGKKVDLQSGTFAGKDAKKVKIALDNARKKTNDDGSLVLPEGPTIAVRVKDGNVFVINTALVSEATAAQAA